jgi:hypothetical protein
LIKKTGFPSEETQKALAMAEIVKTSWEGGELFPEKLQEVFKKIIFFIL